MIPSDVFFSTILIVATITILFAKNKEVDVQNEHSESLAVKTRKPHVKELYEITESMELEEIRTLLKKYTRKAKRIIPDFPEYPMFVPSPPPNKGNYSSKGERCCIEFMELLFNGKKFPKVRPNWLKNKVHNTGRNLELDGFCEELGIAIEYNGVQHYEWPNFTGMTRDEFIRQRERDQYKVETCINKDICLIRIPYRVPLERIPVAIYCKLLESAL